MLHINLQYRWCWAPKLVANEGTIQCRACSSHWCQIRLRRLQLHVMHIKNYIISLTLCFQAAYRDSKLKKLAPLPFSKWNTKVSLYAKVCHFFMADVTAETPPGLVFSCIKSYCLLDIKMFLLSRIQKRSLIRLLGLKSNVALNETADIM